jgi:hypothetical protein
MLTFGYNRMGYQRVFLQTAHSDIVGRKTAASTQQWKKACFGHCDVPKLLQTKVRSIDSISAISDDAAVGSPSNRRCDKKVK